MVYIAGILLLDLLRTKHWWQGLDPQEHQSVIRMVLIIKVFFKHLSNFSFEGEDEGINRRLKGLQARLLGQVLVYRFPESFWDGMLELLIDHIQK